MSLAPQSSCVSFDGDQRPITREITWGLSQVNFPRPHSKRFRSFCPIDETTFASSDGSQVAIWKSTEVTAIIDIKAISIVYIDKLQYIISYVVKSTQLHFISPKPPYNIRVHSTHFSNKIISKMHYFQKSSILIAAGQGLMFTFVNIPTICKGGSTMIDVVKFEKICTHYDETFFTIVNSPVFVDSREIVLVPVGGGINIHLANGNLVQQLSNLSYEGIITTCQYFAEKNWLIAGDDKGSVHLLQFEVKDPFYVGSRKEPCRSVYHFKQGNSQIIFSMLFDENFFVSAALDQQITIVCLKNQKRIQTLMIPIDAILAEIVDDMIMFFSLNEVLGFNVNIFTKHYHDLTSNSTFLKRCPRKGKAARIICRNSDSVLAIFAPKTAEQLFGLLATHYDNDIKNVSYQREEGLDQAYLHLESNQIMIIDFDDFPKKMDPNDNMFTSTTSMHSSILKKDFLKIPQELKFVSLIRICTVDYGNCFLGVCYSGHCYIFSIEQKTLLSQFFTGFDKIITAVFDFEHELVIFSVFTRLIVYDISKRRIVNEEPNCLYTCFLCFDKDKLACGCANGCVEVRRIPKLKLISTTQTYNAFHSDRGKRFPVESFYPHLSDLYKIPFSIKYIDYCPNRRSILSLSQNGEIFIWTRLMYPTAHFNIDFEITAACFLDGNGSLLISSFNNLFSIDSTIIYDDDLLKLPTEFDDFDLLSDDFDVDMFTSEPKLKELDPEEISKATPKLGKFARILAIAADFDQVSRQPTVMKQHVTLDPYDDLVIEEKVIPKKHYVPKIIPSETGVEKLPHREFKFPAYVPKFAPVEETYIDDYEPRKYRKPKKEKKPKKKKKSKSKKDKIIKPKKAKKKSGSNRSDSPKSPHTPKKIKEPKVPKTQPVHKIKPCPPSFAQTTNNSRRSQKVLELSKTVKSTFRLRRRSSGSHRDQELQKMILNHYADLYKEETSATEIKIEKEPTTENTPPRTHNIVIKMHGPPPKIEPPPAPPPKVQEKPAPKPSPPPPPPPPRPIPKAPPKVAPPPAPPALPPPLRAPPPYPFKYTALTKEQTKISDSSSDDDRLNNSMEEEDEYEEEVEEEEIPDPTIHFDSHKIMFAETTKETVNKGMTGHRNDRYPLITIRNYGPAEDIIIYREEPMDPKMRRIKRYVDLRNPVLRITKMQSRNSFPIKVGRQPDPVMKINKK